MRLLSTPRFLLLFVGQAINGIGSWAALIALWGFAAYRFHSTPAEVALLALCWSAPAAVLGPFLGLPIDRFGPRLAHLNGVIQVLAQLSSVPNPTQTQT